MPGSVWHVVLLHAAVVVAPQRRVDEGGLRPEACRRTACGPRARCPGRARRARVIVPSGSSELIGLMPHSYALPSRPLQPVKSPVANWPVPPGLVMTHVLPLFSGAAESASQRSSTARPNRRYSPLIADRERRVEQLLEADAELVLVDALHAGVVRLGEDAALSERRLVPDDGRILRDVRAVPARIEVVGRHEELLAVGRGRSGPSGARSRSWPPKA